MLPAATPPPTRPLTSFSSSGTGNAAAATVFHLGSRRPLFAQLLLSMSLLYCTALYCIIHPNSSSSGDNNASVALMDVGRAGCR